MFLKILITIVLVSSYSHCNEYYWSQVPADAHLADYYWREYFGTVPGDAVLAGKTIDSQNVYIGQAYIKNVGLIVGQLTPGVQEIKVPYGGIQKTDKYIKILCGPQENFHWMKANHTHLHLQVIDKHTVIGGHQDNNGYLNIGRIKQAGEVRIGKVSSFWLEKAWLFYEDNGTEKQLSSYEILLYKSPSANTNDNSSQTGPEKIGSCH